MKKLMLSLVLCIAACAADVDVPDDVDSIEQAASFVAPMTGEVPVTVAAGWIAGSGGKQLLQRIGAGNTAPGSVTSYSMPNNRIRATSTNVFPAGCGSVPPDFSGIWCGSYWIACPAGITLPLAPNYNGTWYDNNGTAWAKSHWFPGSYWTPAISYTYYGRKAVYTVSAGGGNVKVVCEFEGGTFGFIAK
jgi:hypothetical protein